jgi:hypothetical protein
MTFHTILEVTNSFFQVLGAHFPLAVFMTTITGISCKTGWMASRTACAIPMIQRECVLTVEFRRLPCRGIVADGAVRAILSIVLVILLVAGIAIGRSTFVLLIDMTRLTSHLGMFAL